jgi:hypothetical protein
MIVTLNLSKSGEKVILVWLGPEYGSTTGVSAIVMLSVQVCLNLRHKSFDAVSNSNAVLKIFPSLAP